ncbi:MAG: iron chaperone [Methanobacteriota archaeon]
MARTDFRSVDEYIGSLPKEVRATMETVRRAIREAVPEAEEYISYQMPAYRFHGRLLYFSAFKNHYSLFAVTPGVLKTFRKELSLYEGSKKGTVRFSLDEPVPVKLIRVIARYRAKENLGSETKKK